MSEFRTIVSVKPSKQKIALNSGVFTTGSCFADVIGDRLRSAKFSTLVNPFGTSYNPHSIHKSLIYGLKKTPPAATTFGNHNELFFNYDFHTSFADVKQEIVHDRIQKTISSSNEFLADAQWIMITYGTSLVYRHRENNEIVANCHKIPAAEFEKEMMPEKDIVTSFKNFHAQLKEKNPVARIILTVSPVRHLKDTLEINSVSKSILRSACHTITTQFDDVDYFPAYEIMMDDLRDYRFYKSDMIHPTEDAENYIWNKFGERYFDGPILSFLKKWTSIQSALNHKPFHESSNAHQQFLRDTLARLEELKPMVNVDEEIAELKKRQKS